MTLFDNMLDGLPERHALVALSMLAALIALAAVAWWCSRRAAACRPHTVERRAWRFCGRCGWPRPDSGSTPLATRPIRDAITVAGTSTADTLLLPSTLLRRGWTRAAAVDAEGRIVTPCDPQAVVFSLWGAGNRAFDPGGETWRAWIRHLTDILAERHGGMSVQRWNREACRTHSEVVAVSMDIERRMKLEPCPA